jgi:hypothetical protein
MCVKDSIGKQALRAWAISGAWLLVWQLGLVVALKFEGRSLKASESGFVTAWMTLGAIVLLLMVFVSSLASLVWAGRFVFALARRRDRLQRN